MLINNHYTYYFLLASPIVITPTIYYFFIYLEILNHHLNTIRSSKRYYSDNFFSFEPFIREVSRMTSFFYGLLFIIIVYILIIFFSFFIEIASIIAYPIMTSLWLLLAINTINPVNYSFSQIWNFEYDKETLKIYNKENKIKWSYFNNIQTVFTISRNYYFNNMLERIFDLRIKNEKTFIKHLIYLKSKISYGSSIKEEFIYELEKEFIKLFGLVFFLFIIGNSFFFYILSSEKLLLSSIEDISYLNCINYTISMILTNDMDFFKDNDLKTFILISCNLNLMIIIFFLLSFYSSYSTHNFRRHFQVYTNYQLSLNELINEIEYNIFIENSDNYFNDLEKRFEWNPHITIFLKKFNHSSA